MTSKLRAFEDTVLSVREPRELKGSLICSIQDSDIPTLDKRKLIIAMIGVTLSTTYSACSTTLCSSSKARESSNG